MRVLLVHNFYGSESPSGENVCYQAERDLLQRCGSEVIEFVRHSDSIRSRGFRGAVTGGLVTPWNPRNASLLRALVYSARPDVVHIHNTFPLISPAIFWAIRDLPCAIVATLHNYRLFCAAGMPMRNGTVCTECLDKRSVIPGLQHACYRGSVVATAPLALSILLHRGIGTWNKCVDAFVVLSRYQRDTVIEAGLPRERVWVKPHFYPGEPDSVPWADRDEMALFVGRLSPEKGLGTLLQAWSLLGDAAPPLDILGDGPDRRTLETEIAERQLRRIRLLGQLSYADTQKRMAHAKLLLVPSTWFEGFPMVIREAFAHGVPVAASRIGALIELVDDGVNGVLFQPNAAEQLADRVRQLWSDPASLERMSEMARQSYLRFYTEGANYQILHAIYSSAMVARQRRG